MKMKHEPIKTKNIHYWQDTKVYALYYISNNTIYYNLDFAGKCKKIIYQRGQQLKILGSCAGAIKEDGKTMDDKKENEKYKQLITGILEKLNTRRLRMVWLFLVGMAGGQEEQTLDKKVANESIKTLYKIDIKKMLEKLSIEELDFVRKIMHRLLED